MLLRSTTRPPILEVLTKNQISEAFRIDFVNTSMLLRSKTKPPFFSIRGRFDQTSFFFMGGVIVPPSKLIVKNNSPQGFFLLGGVNYEGGRSNQKSSFVRGVIVPPSKLIVNKKTRVLFIRGGFIIKGGRLYVWCVYMYIYIYIYTYMVCIYIYIYVHDIQASS